MRTMLKIRFATDIGNRAIRDGTFSKIMEDTMKRLKPEAAYFVADQGCRCAILFFDMHDAADIPAIAEPLFAGLNAQLEFVPAMNADDLEKGLSVAMEAM